MSNFQLVTQYAKLPNVPCYSPSNDCIAPKLYFREKKHKTVIFCRLFLTKMWMNEYDQFRVILSKKRRPKCASDAQFTMNTSWTYLLVHVKDYPLFTSISLLATNLIYLYTLFIRKPKTTYLPFHTGWARSAWWLRSGRRRG